MNNAWGQLLYSLAVAGPTLTAAANASALAAASPAAGQWKPIIPGGLLTKNGDKIRVTASGIVSCVITTPGTFRLDLRAGSTVIFDTGAIALNVVAKVNVPWFAQFDLTVRVPGAIGQTWGQGWFSSEAGIGAPLPAVGGNAHFNVPVSAVGLGTAWDMSVGNVLDLTFTQTVATGSFTLEQCDIEYKN